MTASPASPARRLAARSPCPTARPTRTVTAIDRPSGTMKNTAEVISAIWWPATATAPKPPGHERRDREHADFEDDGDRDRDADAQQAPKHPPVRRPCGPHPGRRRIAAGESHPAEIGQGLEPEDERDREGRHPRRRGHAAIPAVECSRHPPGHRRSGRERRARARRRAIVGRVMDNPSESPRQAATRPSAGIDQAAASRKARHAGDDGGRQIGGTGEGDTADGQQQTAERTCAEAEH